MKLKLFLLTAALTVNLFSADDSKLVKAKELMKVIQLTKMIDSSFSQVEQFSEQMVSSQNLSPSQMEAVKKQIKSSMAETMKTVKTMDWEKMFSDIYAKVFTKEELSGLIKFYKSPLGKKLLKKQPELMQETMQKVQMEMTKIMPKLQQDIQEAIKTAKQKK